MVSFTGLGAIVGVSWVAFNVGFRAMRSGKTNLLNWMRETTATSKMFTSKILEAAIANARPAIQLRYREYLKDMLDTTQKTNPGSRARGQSRPGQPRKAQKTLEKNITIINKNITDGGKK